MAPNKPQSAEVSEREYQSTLNAAVGATEDEIFTDALGGEELDNDGDTSLEEMGDGLEGEVEEDDEAGEDEPEGDEGESEGDEPEDEPETAEGDEPDQRSRVDDQRVPPRRLKEEADRRRAAEDRVQILERQVAEYNGRLTEISARVNAPAPKPAAEAPPKPDMFAEPEKYEAWLMAEAERRAEERVGRRFSQFEKQQQDREAERVDRSLETAARGARAFEFSAAYNALTSLDPRDRGAQATVRGIYTAPDPAKALFDWWDQNGGPDYREQVLSQLLPEDQRPGSRQTQRAAPQGNRARPVRHEIRPAQRLPSLNSATGSNTQRLSDPEMLDGSEASVFNYGTRR